MSNQVEVFVLIDEAGDYVVAKDRDDLKDKYEEEIGGDLIGSRVITMTMNVELPTPIVATIDVPIVKGALKVAVA